MSCHLCHRRRLPLQPLQPLPSPLHEVVVPWGAARTLERLLCTAPPSSQCCPRHLPRRYACSIGSHCKSNGMLLKVTVTP